MFDHEVSGAFACSNGVCYRYVSFGGSNFFDVFFDESCWSACRDVLCVSVSVDKVVVEEASCGAGVGKNADHGASRNSL